MKIKLGLGRLTADKVASICGGILYTVACENKVLFETVCTDSREADNASMFVAIKGERVDGHSYISNVVKAGCRCVIAERVPLDVKGVAVILVKDSIRAIREIAEYVKSQVEIKTVAVTGSVGKTTTKEFISAVLDRKFNLYKTEGNFNSTIGMPMSMLELNQHHNAAVFEMGMSGLGEIEYMSEAAQPDVAVITNIGSSHLEMLGSRENICRAKMEIATGLKEGGTLFLNGDEPLLQGHESDRYNVLYFGMKNEECDYFASNIRNTESGIVFDMRTPSAQYKNVEINLAEGTTIYSYTTGQEAWYTAYSATDIAMMIKQLNGLIQLKGGSYLTTLPGNGDTQFFNMIMVNVPYLQNAADIFKGNDLDGSFTIGDNVLLDMNDTATGNYTDPIISAIASHKLLSKAPIFRSSNGTIVLGLMGGTTQGVNPFTQQAAVGTAVGTLNGMTLVIPDGLYELDPTNQTLPIKPAGDSIKDGEYLTLYYNSIGIVFGYNESDITEY